MKEKIRNLLRTVMKKDYSYLISLPIFWLQVVGLEAGDHVEITLGSNNELIVKPHKKEEEVEEQ